MCYHYSLKAESKKIEERYKATFETVDIFLEAQLLIKAVSIIMAIPPFNIGFMINKIFAMC